MVLSEANRYSKSHSDFSAASKSSKPKPLKLAAQALRSLRVFSLRSRMLRPVSKFDSFLYSNGKGMRALLRLVSSRSISSQRDCLISFFLLESEQNVWLTLIKPEYRQRDKTRRGFSIFINYSPLIF
jgi:hypothetical protein